MPEYRIYLVNAQGGIVTGSYAQCADDAAACELARSTIGTSTNAEVWQSKRKVGLVSLAPVVRDKLRRSHSLAEQAILDLIASEPLAEQSFGMWQR